MAQFATQHPYLNGLVYASAAAFWITCLSLLTYCIALRASNKRAAKQLGK